MKSAAYIARAARRLLWRTYPWLPLWRIADALDRREARQVLDAWFDHAKECDGC